MVLCSTLQRKAGSRTNALKRLKKCAQDLDVAESECNFSDGCLRKPKLWHEISRLDVTGETFLANLNSAEKCIKFKKIIANNNLTTGQIYNADKTYLPWQCLPTYTAEGGENTT